uniref:Uncharacterized protein n=2 Tax=Caenorhabditis japonica TaxID=281687 RepID=A0A8R1HJZ4_CAEJA
MCPLFQKMEFGAVLAYKRIDAQVEQTLQAAAEVLKNLELRAVLTDGRTVSERTESERSKVRKVEYKPVTLTNCSTSKCSSIGREPKATIRTPRDAQKCQKVFFPPARICSKSERDPSPESSNASASIATTPDSLFPSAIYIPAKKGGQIQNSHPRGADYGWLYYSEPNGYLF